MSAASGDAAGASDGVVREEVRGRVLVIEVDRSAKRNAFTPELFDRLRDALTRLDDDPALWAGVLAFAGAHTTAGLDLPRFAGVFGSAEAAPRDPRVDPFAQFAPDSRGAQDPA
ncbi:MAG: hypothetical protein IT293_04465 [Deltaproteobacteria bacterium]|nr:hypothetical protein [Deltaproteobacteria bacterium]